jgi:hypothetical protein
MIAGGLNCLWCCRPFRARRRGGSPQKFCCAALRTAFHSTARRWAERAVAAGILRVADLKAVPAACTLSQGGNPCASTRDPPPRCLPVDTFLGAALR